MKMPWIRRPAGHVTTRKLTLGDVDDKSRTVVTTVNRPDQYHALGYTGVDMDVAREGVVSTVRRASAAGSLDEYTADFQDATIRAACATWDARVDIQAPARVKTTLALRAQEVELLTRLHVILKAQRQEVADLQASVTGWRDVLLGLSDHAPIPAERVSDTNESETAAPYAAATGASKIPELLAALDTEAADSSRPPHGATRIHIISNDIPNDDQEATK